MSEKIIIYGYGDKSHRTEIGQEVKEYLSSGLFLTMMVGITTLKQKELIS
jgi:hypothetical protein